jgi:alpha-tubulin suppressor-like RCC1 family protein
LKKDGTVVATGWNEHGQCDVSEWQNVAAIAAGGAHTLALLNDGTILAVGLNNENQCNVTEWSEIEAILPAVVIRLVKERRNRRCSRPKQRRTMQYF